MALKLLAKWWIYRDGVAVVGSSAGPDPMEATMPEILKSVFLEGMDVSVESFIMSRQQSSRRYLISAACDCLRQHVPMNEAEILGRSRRIRYAGRN